MKCGKNTCSFIPNSMFDDHRKLNCWCSFSQWCQAKTVAWYGPLEGLRLECATGDNTWAQIQFAVRWHFYGCSWLGRFSKRFWAFAPFVDALRSRSVALCRRFQNVPSSPLCTVTLLVLSVVFGNGYRVATVLRPIFLQFYSRSFLAWRLCVATLLAHLDALRKLSSQRVFSIVKRVFKKKKVRFRGKKTIVIQ